MARLIDNVKNMSSPKLLRKISMSRQKPFKVAILGQNGVGKSAFTVRFLTRRFIGEYDPLLEKVYSCTKGVDGETVVFEVLDTAAQGEHSKLEENIKWADAFILIYSVTDEGSFQECSRLKFLINSYAKRQRKTSISLADGSITTTPVFLVGNQNDRIHDRIVTEEQGDQKSLEMGCASFYEISVRECVDSVGKIFTNLYRLCKKSKRTRQSVSRQLSLPSVIPEEVDKELNSLTLTRRRKGLFTVG
ncbi:ras-related and estrogen-regulated growth inhibitor-like [Mytilus trossulus]|uniref:ras-related and estrogen-regulated growth inhibitor-like n=1 Tax=Mytilus trossulus TaxID=6551 RepID=UPI003004CBD4